MAASLVLDDEGLRRLADPRRSTDELRDLLRRAVRSDRVSRLVLLSRRIADETPDFARMSGFSFAMDVLRGLAAAELHKVVDHPYFGAWLSTAEALIGRDAHRRFPEGHARGHLGRLALFALSAEFAAGRTVELGTRLTASATLAIAPGRRVLLLPLDWAGADVTVGCGPDGVRVTTGRGATVGIDPGGSISGSGELHELPRVEGLRIDVVSDERRHGANAEQFSTATTVELSTWSARIQDALGLIESVSDDLHLDVTTTVDIVVPLEIDAADELSNHTVAAMYGVVASSLPPTEASLAEVLVHETQHSKLHVVEGLSPLVTEDLREDLLSPWRLDPRPARGLLHGAYSFLAVTELWQAIADVSDGPIKADAAAEATRRRRQVEEAIERLDKAGRLTPAGQTFVAAMASTMAGLAPLSTLLAAGQETRIRASIVGHHDAWAKRNPSLPRSGPPLTGGHPGSERTVLAPSTPEETTVLDRLGAAGGIPSNPTGAGSIREDPTLREVGRLAVVDPDGFDELAAVIAALGPSPLRDVLLGHVRYVRRDFSGALASYEAAATRDPDNVDRQVDLAFCLRHLGRDLDADRLIDHLDVSARQRLPA